jgi:putative FmdB family regulatory protein
MPIYDRQCESCGNVWETEEPMNDPAIDHPSRPTCPKCGSKASARIITGRRNFVLKGKGWAKDGYG